MPSEVSLVLRRNLKTRIRKPVRRGSGICKIDVFEPQTLQASVGINKNLIINKTYITLWGGGESLGFLRVWVAPCKVWLALLS